jgi:hypothetical protein
MFYRLRTAQPTWLSVRQRGSHGLHQLRQLSGSQLLSLLSTWHLVSLLHKELVCLSFPPLCRAAAVQDVVPLRRCGAPAPRRRCQMPMPALRTSPVPDQQLRGVQRQGPLAGAAASRSAALAAAALPQRALVLAPPPPQLAGLTALRRLASSTAAAPTKAACGSAPTAWSQASHRYSAALAQLLHR